MKILIASQEQNARQALNCSISQHGHTVITSSSGLHALEVLRNDPQIHVVLTDLSLPSMDGVELFRAARKISRFDGNGEMPTPDFFLVTERGSSPSASRREESLLQQARDEGFADVLFEPIDDSELLQQLAVVERRRLRDKCGELKHRAEQQKSEVAAG